jgi:UDPglucose 6-dehydrogenase
VTSIGAGYVGALTAITMACKNPSTNFTVCDINQSLIDKWNADDVPFYEPQLDSFYNRAKHEIGNITFTSNVAQCITEADVIFISVNTPSLVTTN